MTGNGLCSRGIIREGKVTDKSTHCHRKHDHTIVCHEKKPTHEVSKSRTEILHKVKHSHDEKAIKHLNGIQSSHSDSSLAHNSSPIIPSYKQW